MSRPVVYLIPSQLDETGLAALPAYITEAVTQCRVLFAENQKTARRFLKHLWKVYLPGQEIVIDNFEWITMTEEPVIAGIFKQRLKEGKTIGIISEAGCPGIADPGQQLVAMAHEMNAEIKPLVGPGSVFLALMASGMNGQQFQFTGYLPVKEPERTNAIKELEAESAKKKCTQIFIETPYRNNQLINALLRTCRPSTKLCIAANLTGEKEFIKTNTIAGWKKHRPDLHKQPAVFLLLAFR